jgi:hypothetical protein
MFAFIFLLLGSSRSFQDKDLVGHWKLDDEKTAKTAADATAARHARLVDGPTWTAGKIGGALQFDGKGAHVEIPNADALDKLQEGSYTLSAWFKPDDVPPGTEAQNNASYAIVVKSGWHEGLTFGNEGKFQIDHWLKGDSEEEPIWAGAQSESSFEPGKWYHVVGVVDRAKGEVRIYVNGSEEGSGEFEAERAPRDFEDAQWRIGIALPDSEEWGWAAKGAIDDVRFYKRALPAAEALRLYEEGAKGK